MKTSLDFICASSKAFSLLHYQNNFFGCSACFLGQWDLCG